MIDGKNMDGNLDKSHVNSARVYMVFTGTDARDRAGFNFPSRNPLFFATNDFV